MKTGHGAPDVFIAAIGRSGSTLLANLLTDPPSRWLIIEPRLADGTTGRDVFRQAQSCGYDLDRYVRHVGGETKPESPAETLKRFLSDPENGIEKWGLKEVRAELYVPSLELSPSKVIVLVRDIRAVAASLVAKWRDEGDLQERSDWLTTYLSAAPNSVLRLLDSLRDFDHRVVRYEDFVSRRRLRRSLERWLDWSLTGQPMRNLSDVYGRADEVQLHGERITRRSLDVSRHALDEYGAQLVIDAIAANPEYQARFGYV